MIVWNPRRIVATSIATACLLTAATVAAQSTTPQPGPTEIAAARAQLDAGLTAAHAGRWDVALEDFTRAYALAPHPLVLLDLASAQVHTGHLVAGAESYRRFLREVNSGPAVAQRSTAAAALAAFEPQIARLHVAPSGLRATDRVELDGRVLAPAALGVDLPLDPGPHTLVVVRDAAPIAHADFTLAPSEARSVPLALPAFDARVLPATPPMRPTPHPIPLHARRADHPAITASPWFWTVIGVLAAGGVTTGVVLLVSETSSPFAGTFTPPTLRLEPR